MGKERSNINLQYDRQQQQANNQNAWQSGENAIDRQWQEELWQQQFAEQVKQQNEMFEKESNRWLEQFNTQNEYNLPKNQVTRLRSAGINPAALASQLAGAGNSSASVGGSTGASSPSPSGGSSHGVTPIGFGSVSGLSSDAAMFSSLAQMGDSLATLAKAGSDVSVQQREVGARVKNMVSDANLKDSQTALNNVNRVLTETFGHDKTSAEIKKLLSGAFADYAAGKQSESSAKYNEAMEILTKQDTWQSSEMFPTLLANAKSLGEKIKADTAASYAGAAAARSTANLNNALAATENALRSGKVDYQSLSTELLSIQKSLANRENIRDAATNSDKIAAIVAQCEREGIINEETRQQVIKMTKDNDWNGVEHFFGVLGSATGSVRNISGAYSDVQHVGIGREANQIRQNFNNVWSEYIRSRENDGVSVGSHQYFMHP